LIDLDDEEGVVRSSESVGKMGGVDNDADKPSSDIDFPVSDLKVIGGAGIGLVE
jgi:hypothetical protein